MITQNTNLQPTPIERVLSPFLRFAKLESSGGIALIICAIVAIAVANSPWAAAYHHFWETELSLSAGQISLTLSPLELSAQVGLDVESVKRIVLGLKESGHLRIVDERVEIPDLDTLRELYGLLGVRDQLRGPQRSDPLPAKPANP